MSEIVTPTQSVSWKEIPADRRKAFREYTKTLMNEIRLVKKTQRIFYSSISKGIPAPEYTLAPKHPLARRVTLPDLKSVMAVPTQELLDNTNLPKLCKLARHLHVAASLARGKSMEQIEPLNKEGKHNENYEALDSSLMDWANSALLGEAKLFVVVRPELNPGQRCAQTAHAVTEFLMAHPYCPWLNGTIIIKTAPSNSREGARGTFSTFESAHTGCSVASGLFKDYTDSDITIFEGPSAFVYYGPADSYNAKRCLKEFPLA